jgi:hypothetical protein
LTLAGVQKLMQTMQQNQKSVNDAAVNTTKVGLLNYAKDNLSFDQEGLAAGIALKDPKGKAIFEGQFIPKFEAAYDHWIKDGKDPWQFLTQKNVDSLMEGMRPKAQMQMDRLAATGEGAPPVEPNAPLPPAPAGVNADAWTKVVGVPPPREDGQPGDHAVWAKAVSWLLANPTPEGIKAFNETTFGKTVDGKQILEEFKGGTATQAEPAKPSAVEQEKPAHERTAEEFSRYGMPAPGSEAPLLHVIKRLMYGAGEPIKGRHATPEEIERLRNQAAWMKHHVGQMIDNISAGASD